MLAGPRARHQLPSPGARVPLDASGPARYEDVVRCRSWLAILLFLAAACRKQVPHNALPAASASQAPATSISAAASSAPPSASAATPSRASHRRPSPGAVDVLESEKAFLVKRINLFGVGLYKKLAARPGNFLFSPLGASAGLSLLDAGARGRTAAEVEKALGWKLTPERARAAHAVLLAGSERNGLEHACRLYGPGRFSDPFRREAEQRFGAEIELLPEAPEQARSDLVAWFVERGVVGARVPDLAARRGLVLVQVTSLSSGWRSPFALERTEPAPFRGQSAIPTMHQSLTVPVALADQATIVELPYHDPGLVLDLVWPDSDAGLGPMERALSPEYLENLFAQTKLETIELSLPKFTLASASDLGHDLGSLGLAGLFSATTDWSGMNQPKGTRLAAFLHHAGLSVDEQGSHARAPSKQRSPSGPASRKLAISGPFLVLVRDMLAGTILLMGRVAVPVASGSDG
jgi:serine protease inhibitor